MATAKEIKQAVTAQRPKVKKSKQLLQSMSARAGKKPISPASTAKKSVPVPTPATKKKAASSSPAAKKAAVPKKNPARVPHHKPPVSHPSEENANNLPPVKDSAAENRETFPEPPVAEETENTQASAAPVEEAVETGKGANPDYNPLLERDMEEKDYARGTAIPGESNQPTTTIPEPTIAVEGEDGRPVPAENNAEPSSSIPYGEVPEPDVDDGYPTPPAAEEDDVPAQIVPHENFQDEEEEEEHTTPESPATTDIGEGDKVDEHDARATAEILTEAYIGLNEFVYPMLCRFNEQKMLKMERRGIINMSLPINRERQQFYSWMKQRNEEIGQEFVYDSKKRKRIKVAFTDLLIALNKALTPKQRVAAALVIDQIANIGIAMKVMMSNRDVIKNLKEFTEEARAKRQHAQPIVPPAAQATDVTRQPVGPANVSAHSPVVPSKQAIPVTQKPTSDEDIQALEPGQTSKDGKITIEEVTAQKD